MDRRSHTTKGVHAGILHELGRAIASNVYKEGMPLPREMELQEKFGASRQTVREAIRVLTAKGMVSARKRAGTFVLPRSSWNLLDPDILAWHPIGALPLNLLSDLVEMRRLIEPAAAQFAAERSSPEGLKRIKVALDRMYTFVGDIEHFYEADIEFHLAIFAASGNSLIDRVSTILQPLLEASFKIQSEVNVSAGLQDGYDVHAVVYQAIADRDPQRARVAMEDLLNRALTEVFAKKSA